MNQLTLVYAYYDNGTMLERHCENWRNYPANLAEKLKLILVDDCSPNKPAMMHLTYPDFPVEVYRIKRNIPWNQNGARNLAMHVAADGWCFMTDMDHLLTPEQAEVLLNLDAKQGHYYVPARQYLGQPYKPHPNSFLLTRQAFWECGGYDEDFCGFYGSDSVFRRALTEVNKRVELEEPYLVLYENVIEDANTKEWGRKNTEYHSMKFPLLREKRKRAPYKAENHLRFEWERLR